MQTGNKQGNEQIFENIQCNLCGSVEYKVIIEPRIETFDPGKILAASKGIRNTQRIVRCLNCGLVYVNPRIRAEIVEQSYEQSIDEVYIKGAVGRQQTFAQYAKKISRWRKTGGRLLDVGCAAGFFVHEARNYGWDAAGIEPSKWLVSWGIENLGEKLYAGTLSQAKFNDGDFDVLTMWDVLEHVPDPASELKECSRVLKKGGMLIINYPDFGSMLARLAGRNWWFLLSNHLYYFTQKTMRRYLECAGFRVDDFSMHWQTLTLGYLAQILSIYSPKLSRLSQRIFKALRLDKLPLPYYAAQSNVVATKI